MNLPNWKSNAGERVHAAFWLVSEVGEGEPSGKLSSDKYFRESDRMIRTYAEFRRHSCDFSTYVQERRLALEELRFITIGDQVWETLHRATFPNNRLL